MSESMHPDPRNPAQPSCVSGAGNGKDGEAQETLPDAQELRVEEPVRVKRPARGRRLLEKEHDVALTAEQRLLLLDTWRRSALLAPATARKQLADKPVQLFGGPPAVTNKRMPARRCHKPFK